MPYDRRHVVIQWGGTLPGGEIWTNMLRMGNSETGDSAPVPTFDALEEWLHNDLADAIEAWHGRADTKIHTACKLTFVKANVVDMSGHYTDPMTHEHVYPTPVPGGSALVYHPNQVSWVVSTTTGRQRGPAHRGRFYMPAPSVEVQATNGLVQAGDATLVGNSAKQLIEQLGDTPFTPISGTFPLNFKVLVMSKKAGAPATYPVTGVQVGRVLDTQQRRRRELQENYVSVVVDQGIF